MNCTWIGVVGQAGMAVALGDLARQHRAGGAVGVADRRARCAPARRARARPAPRAISLRSRIVVDLVVLRLAVVDGDARPAASGLVNSCEKSRPLRLPVLDQLALVEHLHLPDHLVEACGSRCAAISSRTSSATKKKIVDDVLGLADEALAQHRVLRRDADRAGVEMALAHHDAAGGDQRRGGEAELVGAEQRADHDVAAGADAAVDLHGDAAAQPVGHQRLVRLGEPDLPRASRHA